MGTNKMYKVERIITETKDSETIFIGRIRDARKCIKTIEEEYKIRGFETLSTEFSLLIYERGKALTKWIYVIDKNEKQNNSSNRR